MLLIQFRKKQEMDTQTGFWGQTTGDRKHRYIGKHTYGIKIRDLVRKTAFGINFSVIGIENQSNIDYTFPVRAMSYDVGEYEKMCIRDSVSAGCRFSLLYGFPGTEGGICETVKRVLKNP